MSCTGSSVPARPLSMVNELPFLSMNPAANVPYAGPSEGISMMELETGFS